MTTTAIKEQAEIISMDSPEDREAAMQHFGEAMERLCRHEERLGRILERIDPERCAHE